MFDAIPESYYVQFLNDISYRLMQRVCSLKAQFESTDPVHIFQHIGVVILDYLKDLRTDWFGGKDQLKEVLDKWNLVMVLNPDAAPAAVSASAPLTPAQQEHQQRVTLATPAKQESKAEQQALAKSVEEGRKRVKELQLQRQARDAAEQQPAPVQSGEVSTASGSTVQEVVQQPSDSSEPVHVKVRKLRTEEQQAENISNIALTFPPNPNLEFKVSDMSQITTAELDQLPQDPKFWIRCIESVCRQCGMTDRQTNTFGIRAVERACQMVGVGTAEASVPQVLHPMVGDAPVEGQEDSRALWVILADTWENFGPESWMRRAFRYMMPLSSSDVDC